MCRMILRGSRLLFVLFLLSGICPASAQMIADITTDIETEFGTYHPYVVEIDPRAEQYTVDPGFGNVVNYSDFTFTSVEESLLAANYFVVSPGRDEWGTGYCTRCS